ncbi:M1 family metallopeptidase [Sphingomonas sp. TZW2008]|uniref:M1 family metallopeptidase n=1 Tax=Sphingomonas sp. TZW2008 TaxID=1917973 RepID=UPI000A26A01C|nr:M1 family metallopeptidase [Sphingomonas sp. TZW2008]
MRAFLLATALSFVGTAAGAQNAPAPRANAIVADPAAPKGRLSDAAMPKAYRLDFTIQPAKTGFSGRGEIDVALKAATRRLYLHGRDLAVKASARVGGRMIPATFTQVDKTGTARLDFAQELPAGAVTLVFDWTGSFGDSASGLYRVKVGEQWYSWTQFESIDARAAFPSFDEPGFKTPFTVSITTDRGSKAVSNAPETGVTPDGALEKHQFAATRPLPTYLVALVTGPFVHATGTVPPTPERTQPLPLGAVLTQAQRDKTGYVMAETPRIVSLLEKYFGAPFPFPKLDQIGSPIMPGAMENAGADIYGDGIIALAPDAPVSQKKLFGMVVAHELAHQWFGDLVSPVWWDDLWLNESFANWMGFRIGGEWRPELNIGVGGLEEGFSAMNTDSLTVGRPIHEPIRENAKIDSAFDGITYGKGGHVIAMIAAYLGDEKFRDGVRLHLKRHAYGSAATADFFKSLADAAQDPRVVTAMQSFVDQQGVPLISLTRQGGRMVATQSRYTFIGQAPQPTRWTVPFCYRVGEARSCQLIDGATATIDVPAGNAALMPNAGGNGYYRFDMPAADWDRLIVGFAQLSGAEAIAASDSLWASFRAGRTDAARVLAGTVAMAGNADSNAALDGGQRLAGMHSRGLIPAAALPAYRAFLDRTYAPRLAALGFDPAAGAHAGDDPDRQKLRADTVALLAGEAEDRALLAKLAAAAERYLGGDKAALDATYLGDGFGAVVQQGGLPAAKRIMEAGLASEEPVMRDAAFAAVADSGQPAIATWALALNDPRLRTLDRANLIQRLALAPGTATMTGDWFIANIDKVLGSANGIFAGRVARAFATQCGVDRAAQIDAAIGARIRADGNGVLDYERTLENIRLCGALRDAKSAELGTALRQAK